MYQKNTVPKKNIISCSKSTRHKLKLFSTNNQFQSQNAFHLTMNINNYTINWDYWYPYILSCLYQKNTSFHVESQIFVSWDYFRPTINSNVKYAELRLLSTNNHYTFFPYICKNACTLVVKKKIICWKILFRPNKYGQA